MFRNISVLSCFRPIHYSLLAFIIIMPYHHHLSRKIIIRIMWKKVAPIMMTTTRMKKAMKLYPWRKNNRLVRIIIIRLNNLQALLHNYSKQHSRNSGIDKMIKCFHSHFSRRITSHCIHTNVHRSCSVLIHHFNHNILKISYLQYLLVSQHQPPQLPTPLQMPLPMSPAFTPHHHESPP